MSHRLAPLLLLALACAGCATTPTLPGPTLPDTLCWSPDIAWGASGWRCELSDTLGPDFLLVDCHGGTDPDTGKWALYPYDGEVLDAKTVAWVLRHLTPAERKIAFVSCNRDGLPLRVRGVWYATKLVTAFPRLPIPGDANSADDFIEGHP